MPVVAMESTEETGLKDLTAPLAMAAMLLMLPMELTLRTLATFAYPLKKGSRKLA